MAATHPLNGVWVLNHKNSDSPDDLLSAQGVGWAKRKVICGLNVTETLTISDNQALIYKETSVKNISDTIPLNTPQDLDDDILGKCTLTAKVEGNELIIDFKGDAGQTTNTRSVSSDGKLLTFVSVFTDKKGAKITCTRRFDRKS